MLTARQNMIECITPGGKPDRFVNNFEALQFVMCPYLLSGNMILNKGDMNVVNSWGVTYSFPENTPGQFPVHTPDKIVVKDIENWRDYVKGPSLEAPKELWDVCMGMYEAVDQTKSFATPLKISGLFEQSHHLCEITNALTYYIEYEEEMHDFIKYLVDWEVKFADDLCDHFHPEVLFYHDDWGSQNSTFLSRGMFQDFFLEAYKTIYGRYKERGVKYIIHHSDSYAKTLVPDMIEMGIDVWQGCMWSNDIPELIQKYGGQISFMGGIDNKFVDKSDWSEENNKKYVDMVCSECGDKYFIPCIVQGGPGSTTPGVYANLVEVQDQYNKEKYGLTEDAADFRQPLQILF